jgi:hypothetical protein
MACNSDNSSGWQHVNICIMRIAVEYLAILKQQRLLGPFMPVMHGCLSIQMQM